MIYRTPTFLFFLLIAFLLTARYEFSFAQSSSNFIQYNNNTPLTFALNNTTVLENQQTISDGFCLYLKSNVNSSHIYASATVSTTTTTPMPVSNLVLSFYSTDCPGAYYSSLNTADIPLSTSNQLLFAQVRRNSFYNYCYSLKMAAAGYTYAPGTYTFTMTFTMSQP